MKTAGRDVATLFVHGTLGGDSDGQLLARFVAGSEAAVFEELVRRHGPMVWGVCRRVAGNTHDAEDAFQAAFLVLARRAQAIAHGEKLASWLYGTACRTARKARTLRARRQARERPLDEHPEPATPASGSPLDLEPWLDRELSRLPEKYRVPVILCALEGKTHREAAGQLGWPVGTVSGRLSRAKSLLARRLARRGLIVSGATLAASLSATASQAAPSLLVARTIACEAGQASTVSPRVAALVHGVLKTMLVARTGLAAGILACLGALGIAAAGPATAEQEGRDRPEASQPAKATKSTDLDALQGTWRIVETTRDDHTTITYGPDNYGILLVVKDRTVARHGGQYGLNAFGFTQQAFRLDEQVSPRTITFLPAVSPDAEPHAPTHAIYAIQGRRLTICAAPAGGPTPANFLLPVGSRQTLEVYERIPPEALKFQQDRWTLLRARENLVSMRDTIQKAMVEVEIDYVALRKSEGDGVNDPQLVAIKKLLTRLQADHRAVLDSLKALQVVIDRFSPATPAPGTPVAAPKR